LRPSELRMNDKSINESIIVEYDVTWLNDFMTIHNLTVRQFLDLFECPDDLRDTLNGYIYPRMCHYLSYSFMKDCRDFLDDCKRKIGNEKWKTNLSKLRPAGIIETMHDRYEKKARLYLQPFQDPSAACWFVMKGDTLTVRIDVKKEVTTDEVKKKIIEDIMNRDCLYDIKNYVIQFYEMTYF
jgi:hypothetical protein